MRSPRRVASRLSALNRPQIAISKMAAKGKALAMVAVCSALRPLASSSAMATAPMLTDQKMRCHKGEWPCPDEASISTTSAPESAEVTKNTTTMSTAINEMTLENGKCSRKANRARELS
ncbi:hypothetical protein D3C75_905710 [compost metagenome]